MSLTRSSSSTSDELNDDDLMWLILNSNNVSSTSTASALDPIGLLPADTTAVEFPPSFPPDVDDKKWHANDTTTTTVVPPSLPQDPNDKKRQRKEKNREAVRTLLLDPPCLCCYSQSFF